MTRHQVSFQVSDMSCGHCQAAITRAVQALDPAAQVDVDLAAHRVQVRSASADAAALQHAISEAGYTPVRDGAAA